MPKGWWPRRPCSSLAFCHTRRGSAAGHARPFLAARRFRHTHRTGPFAKTTGGTNNVAYHGSTALLFSSKAATTTIRATTSALSASTLPTTTMTIGTLLTQASPLALIAYALLALYFATECAFYFYFHRVIVPKANQRVKPQPYLDYPHATDRHRLLERILQRLQQQAVREKVPISTVLTQFFIQWFAKDETKNDDDAKTNNLLPGLMRTQSSTWTSSTASTTDASTQASTTADDSSSISSTEEEDLNAAAAAATTTTSTTSSSLSSHQPKAFWSIPGIGHAQITSFLAWALFAKEHDALTAQELAELDLCLDILRVRTGLVFPNLPQSPYTARRLCLEDVSPLHRPLLVYVAVEAMRWGASWLLRLYGFRPTNHKLVPGWYRPGKSRRKEDVSSPPQLPLVFFHGIAPAGLAFYLPMIRALTNDGRPTLLVEQVSISGRLGTFGAVNETEMMQAVQDMIDETIDADPATRGLPLLWAGHSFGSCPLAWMVRHEKLVKRTAGLHLLDPVTILLSEPAVMMNFLYSREVSKIRMVAASEVFTEYYLRRHFAWYNAEAWVDEQADYPVTVALSECDEIVNAPAVAAYLSAYPHAVRTIFWPGARHAQCVSSPSKWRQLQQSLWQQEATYWQKQQS